MFEFVQSLKPRVYRGKELHQGKKIWITVKTRPFGEPIILYKCMECGADLKSLMSEIETEDFCPKCEHEFIVPGSETYQRFFQIILQEKRDKEAALKQKKEVENQKLEEQRLLAKALKQQELEDKIRETIVFSPHPACQYRVFLARQQRICTRRRRYRQ